MAPALRDGVGSRPAPPAPSSSMGARAVPSSA